MLQTIRDTGIDSLVHSVYELGRVMRRRMMTCDTGEIHMGQIHALFLIQEKPGITMKEVADGLRVSSPSATSFVDRLVKLGYVERIHDEENRRLVRLTMSPSGAKFLKEKMAQRREIFAEILGTLSPADQEALLQILRKVLSRTSS